MNPASEMTDEMELRKDLREVGNELTYELNKSILYHNNVSVVLTGEHGTGKTLVSTKLDNLNYKKIDCPQDIKKTV